MTASFGMEVEDDAYTGDTRPLVAEDLEVEEAESTLEQVYAASLLARPDLLVAVSPETRFVSDPTVRAMIAIVQSQGAAYTAPGPMWAALDALPITVDSLVAEGILSMVPDPHEVDLGRLLKLKNDVELAAIDRTATAKIDRAVKRLGKAPREMVYAEIREALELVERSRFTERDHTTKGIRERLRTAPPKVRWRIGSRDLDEAFPGLGPNGTADFGLLGAGEVAMLLAQYGVGKTRVAQNWEDQVLTNYTSSSVAHVMLEDDETAGSTKLIGIHADAPFWQVERYARGELGFMGQDAALQHRLDAGLDWFDSLGDRLRFYDGEARADVFDYDQLIGLLELDVRMYKTTHIIIDYVQALRGSDYETVAKIAQGLRAFAGRHKVCLIEVSQVSNDTIKWGSVAGQVAAKGAGDWGQAAHVGIELGWQEDVGQAELALHLKKARNARRQTVYCAINEDTGRIKSYHGTPLLMSLPEKKTEKKGGKR